MLFAAVHEPAIDASRQFAALHQFGRFGAKRTFSEPRLQNWFRSTQPRNHRVADAVRSTDIS